MSVRIPTPRHCFNRLMQRSTALRRQWAARPVTPAAASCAIGSLVGGFRDHRADPASVQVGADRPGRVHAVGEHDVRAYSSRATDRARDPDHGHDVLEPRCVARLSGDHDERERTTPAVGRVVGFDRRSTARSPRACAR